MLYQFTNYLQQNFQENRCKINYSKNKFLNFKIKQNESIKMHSKHSRIKTFDNMYTLFGKALHDFFLRKLN